MAFLGSTFDATQIEPATPFEVIQPGKYHVQIVNSEMRITKGGSGQYLWLELAIQDGQHANKRIESFCGAQPTQKLCWTERPESGRSGLWNFQRRV